jgi:hypothetical protein
MPRYHFAVRNSDRHDDPDGTELADDAAAREYAMRVIRELQHGDGDNWRGWTMEVTQDGRRVWQIPFETIEPSDPSPS